MAEKEKRFTNRKYGVEIEISSCAGYSQMMIAQAVSDAGVDCRAESYNHRTRTWWKVVTDGSCWLELVSPPMSGLDGLRQTEIVCSVLNRIGAKVDSHCGLHIHHEVADYREDNFRNLVGLYIKWEKLLDAFLPPSRRNNNSSYAGSMRSGWNGNESVEESLTRLASANTTRQYVARDASRQIDARYHKVNVESYYRHGTIEFRSHSGTTEFDKIRFWIFITQSLVEKATATRFSTRPVKVTYHNFWRRFFYNCADEVAESAREFANARFAHFNPNADWQTVFAG